MSDDPKHTPPVSALARFIAGWREINRGLLAWQARLHAAIIVPLQQAIADADRLSGAKAGETKEQAAVRAFCARPDNQGLGQRALYRKYRDEGLRPRLMLAAFPADGKPGRPKKSRL